MVAYGDRGPEDVSDGNLRVVEGGAGVEARIGPVAYIAWHLERNMNYTAGISVRNPKPAGYPSSNEDKISIFGYASLRHR